MADKIDILAADGYPLSATLFTPDAPNQSAVLINSAMAVMQGYYAPYATYLAKRGFTVLTYDYRGIGASMPKTLRGFDAGVLTWADQDQNAMHRWLGEHYPNHRRYVIGHSFGGQIIGLTPIYPEVAGWMTVAAQNGYWGLWDGFDQARMMFLWYVTIPLLTKVFGYLPGKRFGLGNDVPARVALEWAQGCRNRNYFLDMYAGTEHDTFSKVNVPIVSYSFSDDDYATRRSVDDWFERFPNAPVTRTHLTPTDLGVPKIGHFGFFRKQFAESLWSQSVAWLGAAG